MVVAYRQRTELFACLDSCLRAVAGVAGGAEVIVVDNGSLAATVRARHPDLRVVEPGFNTGFAGGANRGTAVARGRWIALINDDATVEVDTLRLMLEAGERSPQIGSVAAQVRFSGAPECINSAGIAIDRRGVATERLAGAPVAAARAPAEVFGASAACALYRRSMLDSLRGFDERFFAYLEDVDLAWRARSAGWSCAYEPRAIAHHRGSATAGHASAGKYFLVGRNRVWLLARNLTTAQLLRAFPAILLYDLAYIAYVAVTDRTLAPLRGRLSGLRTWGGRRRERAGERGGVRLARAGRRASLGQHEAYRKLAAAD